ncbi:MAG: glycosyltransferase family 4 protein [Candidatus Acidiferrales bacterium]
MIDRNCRVAFDFDDAVHVGHRDTETIKYSWVYKLKYGPGINGALRRCLHVIAGNRTLAEHALRFNTNVTIIPTVVDLQLYSYQAPREGTDTITIGWVGSRSTSPYLLAIESALRRLSEVHGKRVRFRTFGDPRRKLAVPDFEAQPFCLASEIDDLRTIDVGIMPMPENEWTRGKCGFKAIQYMALGIPSVVSAVGMVSDLIKHGKNGLVARTEAEWFSCLDCLVRDAELRRRLSANGRLTVERDYSLQLWAPRFAALLERIVSGGQITDFATV